jgi:dimethylargininase
MLIALTREVSPAIGRCELTHLSRVAIDYERACLQHLAYERALQEAGCAVARLDATAELADSVFVEDLAVVFDELAVIARPGALSRRPEISAVAEFLSAFRPLRFIEQPDTLDGGDVLRAGRTVFVGVSGRTNVAAAAQLRNILQPFSYAVRPVVISGCLHLKSAATAVDERRLLVNPSWVDVEAFSEFELIHVDRAEPFGANIVRAGGALVYPAAFPRTRARLETAGLRPTTIDVSELAKAEGAATCCSLIFSLGAQPSGRLFS